MNPLRIVVKRNDTDCGIAAMAMLWDLPYEDVLIAAARVAPCENGLYLTQIQKVAEELDVQVSVKKKGRYDPEQARGILHVSNTKKHLYHLVILDRGRVVETEDGGSLWDYEAYLKAKRFKPGSLVVLEGE